MRWFEGNVSEAINETRRIGALFVVYITGGKDVEEAHMSECWEAVDVEKDLPWRVVAIKLKAGSEDANSFAQIYPVPMHPITYFIDGNGKPTNVVLFNKIEPMDAAKFRENLPKLVFPIPGKEAASGLTRIDGSTPVAAAAAPSTSAAPTAAAPATQPTISQAEQIAAKIRLAKALVESKKQQEEEKKRKEQAANDMRMREERDRAREYAEERRNKELLEAAAARRKDKLESAKEKERVKEQIKADKAEREARFRQQSSQASPTEEKKTGIAPPTTVASDRCRIQLRFPDGSVALHDFPSADTLASLRQIVAADARVRGSPFRLAQPAPRRIYTEEEMETTFLQLALTPASTLLVLTDSPSGGFPAVAAAVSGAVQPAYNPMTTLIGFVTYLIFTPIQYILSLIGMGGGRGEEKKKDDAQKPSTSTAQQGAGDAANAAGVAARRRHQGGSTIHTLGSQAEEPERRPTEDDPEANWNGNSTQFL